MVVSKIIDIVPYTCSTWKRCQFAPCVRQIQRISPPRQNPGTRSLQTPGSYGREQYLSPVLQQSSYENEKQVVLDGGKNPLTVLKNQN